MCIGPVLFRRSWCSPLLALMRFLHLSHFPEPRGEGLDGAILFSAECSKVSFSAYYLAVDLCICSKLLQDKASLMVAEQGTDL